MWSSQNANPQGIGPRLPPAWGFWATAFFGFIAYGVFLLAAWLAYTVVLTVGGAQAAEVPGRLLGIGGLAGDLAAIAVLWGAIRERRREFPEYLALNWPSRKELATALTITAILLFIPSIINESNDVPATWAKPYLSVGSASGLLVLLISGCITGPMSEEFVCRGFMFRGWSESPLGPVSATVLISALWAVTHIQYDWEGQFYIFLSGLVLGYFRWRSNSTWLTVVLHSVMNVCAFLTMGRYV